MALCLALNASANPPARLPLPPLARLFGVARPESVPLPPPPLLDAPGGTVRLTALSRWGGGGGIGLRPAVVPAVEGMGRLEGGAGGVGLARRAVELEVVPFVVGVVE